MPEKRERKWLAHYINATPEAEPTYEIIGEDLEELNVDMNAEVETKTNILGKTSVNLSSYAPQAAVEPYYIKKGSALSDYIQNIIDKRLTLDKVKTDVVEVHTDKEEGVSTYAAYREPCIIEVVSYGGDTSGYQGAYNIHYLGDRVEGTFDPISKSFTATEA